MDTPKPRGRKATKCSCRIWDLWAANPSASAAELPGMAQGARQIKISWDSQWLLTGNGEEFDVWPLGIPQLLKVAQTTVGREFTDSERARFGLRPVHPSS